MGMDRIFRKLSRYFRDEWQVGVLDLEIGLWIKPPLTSNIAYLKAQNAQGRHIRFGLNQIWRDII